MGWLERRYKELTAALIVVSVLTGFGIAERIKEANPPTVFVVWEVK